MCPRIQARAEPSGHERTFFRGQIKTSNTMITPARVPKASPHGLPPPGQRRAPIEHTQKTTTVAITPMAKAAIQAKFRGRLSRLINTL